MANFFPRENVGVASKSCVCPHADLKARRAIMSVPRSLFQVVWTW